MVVSVVVVGVMGVGKIVTSGECVSSAEDFMYKKALLDAIVSSLLLLLLRLLLLLLFAFAFIFLRATDPPRKPTPTPSSPAKATVRLDTFQSPILRFLCCGVSGCLLCQCVVWCDAIVWCDCAIV